MDGHDNPSFDASNSDTHFSGNSAKKDEPVLSTEEPASTNASDKYEKEDLRCGYGDCKPAPLQCCNNPKAYLFWISLCAFLQGFVVNGITNVNTSSVERRFHLSSRSVGLIASSYDIAAGILVLPITYFGTYGHQPRMLAAAALLLSGGSFIMSLSHFITGNYELGQDIIEVCDTLGNSSVCVSSSGLSNYRYVFMLGQLLQGAGGTTLYTLGIVYMDSNVKAENFPLYQGMIQTSSALGPAVGFVLGGTFLNIYVDADTIDPGSVMITPDDPRWVGAWWIGYVLAGSLMAMIAVAIYPFPKITPVGLQALRMKISEAHQDGSEEVCSRPGFFKSWRDIPVAIKVVVCNPVLMFATLATVSEGMLVSGFLAFLPKLIQNQFAQTSSWSAYLAGFASIPAMVVGNLIGGVLVKCLKLKVTGMLRLNIVNCLLGAGFVIAALIHCDAAKLAGVIVPYHQSSSDQLTEARLTSDCNDICGCNAYEYEPVCGSDGVQYFTACHAGCLGYNSTDDSRIYSGCSCVASSLNVTSDIAISGPCETDCNSMSLFLIFCFIVFVLTMAIFVPGTNIKLRCLPENQRAFGLGVNAVLYRFLGSVPGPLLFGFIFDSSCLVWQEECDGQGSCWVYDNAGLSTSIVALSVVIKLLSASFYSLALFFYKPPTEEKLVIAPAMTATASLERSSTTGTAAADSVDERSPNSVGSTML